MIRPGNYSATVASHAISETKSGAPQAVVTFNVKTDSGLQKLSWYGSFSEKAIAITAKALLACGLKGNNPAGDLEIGKEVSLVIENEINQEGKEITKVKWVNKPGAIKNVISPEIARMKLSSLEGAIMQARAENNNPDDDVIPF